MIIDPSIIHVMAVDVRAEDRPWPWREENRAAIEEHWRKATAREPTLFDGRVFLFTDERIQDTTFHAVCFETDYASLLYWKDLGFPEAGVTNGFAMGALQSADDAFLLGVMGPHTANKGQVYFPAGTPDPDDLTDDGRLDLDGSMVRELEEETGITAAEIEPGLGWIVVRDGASLAFMRVARLPGTAEEIRARILARMKDLDEEELSDIKVVRSAADIDERTMPRFVQAFLRWSFEERLGGA